MLKKITKFITTTYLISIGIVVLYLLIRIFAYDVFSVPTSSMEPTLLPGDKILVSKTIVGPRLYSPLSSAFTEYPSMCRLKGFRPVERNDVLVFNFPLNDGHISFKLNYVYCKRCVALPGDTISIVNGVVKNNNFNRLFVDKEAQRKLMIRPDSILRKEAVGIYQADPQNMPWIARDIGPVYVPRKEDIIQISSENFFLYRQIIEFETGEKVKIDNEGKITLGKERIQTYTFRNNYYYVLGDNLGESSDSRHWGFLPESFIIGVATRIVYSVDPISGKIRKERCLKRIR